MAEKKTISAREVVADIRVGMTDDQLMAKHRLTAKGLESLKNKLLTAGLITEADLDGKALPTQVATQVVDKKVFARNIAEAVKSGLPDNEVMKRFGISAAKLPAVFGSLIKAEFMTQEDLDRRPEGFEQTVDLGPDVPAPASVAKPASNQRPVFTWLCPACNTPHSQEYAVCPQCGIIVEKYKAKIARTKQAGEAVPVVGPEQMVRDYQPNTAPGAHPHPVSRDTPVAEVPQEFAEKMTHLRDALNQGILSQAEFDKKSEELMLRAKHSEAQDKLKSLLDAGIITQEEFEAKKADPLQHQSKLEKLQEALESGVLSQSEFDRKRQELLGIQGSPASRIREAAPLYPKLGSPDGALGYLMGMPLGEKLIIIASGLAVLSLFLPWAEIGAMRASGFQQQGWLFLPFFAYPLIQTLRRADFSRIAGAMCGGLSTLISILFMDTKSATLFGHEINAAGTGLYLFTFCSILLGAGAYLHKPRNEESAGGSLAPSQGVSKPASDLSGAETELGSVVITLTKWWIVNASGKMIVTNHRLLFSCELWWLFAIITAGISYYVLKIGKEPLEFRWADIAEIVPTRHLFICDGILIRMKSGIKHDFYFTLFQAKDKDKLMELIDRYLR